MEHLRGSKPFLRFFAVSLSLVGGLALIAFTIQDAKLYCELVRLSRFTVLAITFIAIEAFSAIILIRLGFVLLFKLAQLGSLVKIGLLAICGSILVWRLLALVEELKTFNWQLMSMITQSSNRYFSIAAGYEQLSAQARALELMLDFANNGWKIVSATFLISVIGYYFSKRLGWSKQTTQASSV